MKRSQLTESNFAIASSAGIATVSLGPMRAFETWYVSSASAQSNSSVLVPTARIYRGGVADSTLKDGTYTGTLDTTDLHVTLRSGDKLVAQWIGADVGSRCTLTVDGEKETP